MRYCHACGAAQDEREPDALVGDLTISLYGDCWWRGTLLKLTLQETRVVHALARDPGRFRRPEDLAVIAEASSRNHLHSICTHIRAKFREIDQGFDRLQNRRRFGYRWALEGQ